eukprot:PLAT10303.1.p1 GENE.PLAT10303.1~~PLAT10303.1.p1  ORF type:complete len:687 (+),score=251.13 PLAT10303.1:66-2063(+)
MSAVEGSVAARAESHRRRSRYLYVDSKAGTTLMAHSKADLLSMRTDKLEEDSSAVHSWGEWADSCVVEPIPMPFGADVVVVDACFGGDFALARSADGQLYAWGSNDFGNLGVGDTARRDRPTIVPALEEKIVVSAAAGDWHCAAVTTAGEVWCWGRADSGQCGLGRSVREPVPIPTVVRTLQRGAVLLSSVVAQCDYTVALAMDGHVFAWGKGGQVDELEETEGGLWIDSDTPLLMEGLEGHTMQSIRASGQRLLALNGSLVGGRRRPSDVSLLATSGSGAGMDRKPSFRRAATASRRESIGRVGETKKRRPSMGDRRPSFTERRESLRATSSFRQEAFIAPKAAGPLFGELEELWKRMDREPAYHDVKSDFIASAPGGEKEIDDLEEAQVKVERSIPELQAILGEVELLRLTAHGKVEMMSVDILARYVETKTELNERLLADLQSALLARRIGELRQRAEDAWLGSHRLKEDWGKRDEPAFLNLLAMSSKLYTILENQALALEREVADAGYLHSNAQAVALLGELCATRKLVNDMLSAPIGAAPPRTALVEHDCKRIIAIFQAAMATTGVDELRAMHSEAVALLESAGGAGGKAEEDEAEGSGAEDGSDGEGAHSSPGSTGTLRQQLAQLLVVMLSAKISSGGGRDWELEGTSSAGIDAACVVQ